MKKQEKKRRKFILLTCTPILRGTFSGNTQSVGKNACPNDTARKRFSKRPEDNEIEKN